MLTEDLHESLINIDILNVPDIVKQQFFVILSLVTSYFTGPLGLVLYWLIRIFYAKKINYYD